MNGRRIGRRALLAASITGALSACAKVEEPDTGDIDDVLRGARGRVVLEPRHYRATGTVDVTDMQIDGQGALVTFGADSTGSAGFRAQGDAAIANLTVFGPGTAQGGPSIGIQATSGDPSTAVQLDGVHVSGFRVDGVYLGGPLAVTVRGVRAGGNGTGVVLSGVASAKLMDSDFASNTANGLHINYGRQITVTRANAAHNGAHGLLFEYAQGITVHSSTATGNAADGVVFGGGDATAPPCSDVHVQSCHAVGNGQHGISVDVTRAGAFGRSLQVGGTLDANICTGNHVHGIAITCSAGMQLRRNRSSDNGQCGIGLSTSATAVIDNVCDGNGTWGIGVFGVGNPAYDFGGHMLVGNELSGNRLGSVSS